MSPLRDITCKIKNSLRTKYKRTKLVTLAIRSKISPHYDTHLKLMNIINFNIFFYLKGEVLCKIICKLLKVFFSAISQNLLLFIENVGPLKENEVAGFVVLSQQLFYYL